MIPLAKYNKAMYTQVSLGMRFRMMFETEESGVRRYMGTVTGMSDLDPVRWKNSQWRNLQVILLNSEKLNVVAGMKCFNVSLLFRSDGTNQRLGNVLAESRFGILSLL